MNTQNFVPKFSPNGSFNPIFCRLFLEESIVRQIFVDSFQLSSKSSQPVDQVKAPQGLSHTDAGVDFRRLHRAKPGRINGWDTLRSSTLCGTAGQAARTWLDLIWLEKSAVIDRALYYNAANNNFYRKVNERLTGEGNGEKKKYFGCFRYTMYGTTGRSHCSAALKCEKVIFAAALRKRAAHYDQPTFNWSSKSRRLSYDNVYVHLRSCTKAWAEIIRTLSSTLQRTLVESSYTSNFTQ